MGITGRRVGCAAIACAVLVGMLARPASAATATYAQPTDVMVDSYEPLDVLVVPPHHGQLLNGHSGIRLLNDGDPSELNPLMNSYMKALRRAIADWQKAIRTFGSRSLRQLKIRTYVLGRDVPPMAALQDPEVIIGWDETKGPVLGVSVYSTDGSSPCVTLNSMLAFNSFSYPDMYNTSAHEFGHCLGLDHAQGGKGITRDLMYGVYGQDIGLEDNTLLCMSNLNVKGLELVYDGRPSPSRASVSVKDYKQIRCG